MFQLPCFSFLKQPRMFSSLDLSSCQSIIQQTNANSISCVLDLGSTQIRNMASALKTQTRELLSLLPCPHCSSLCCLQECSPPDLQRKSCLFFTTQSIHQVLLIIQDYHFTLSIYLVCLIGCLLICYYRKTKSSFRRITSVEPILYPHSALGPAGAQTVPTEKKWNLNV